MESRLHWVDAGKGLAIILVVLNHTLLFLTPLGLRDEWWHEFNELLRTMRMPLFFFLAGLFSHKWVRGSWRSLVANKVALFFWLYALWSTVRFAFFAMVPNVANPNEGSSALRFFAQAIWSSTDLWFIYALAVFFILAKTMSPLPAWAQLGIAGAASLLWFSGAIELPSSLWNGIPSYFVFFLAPTLFARSSIISLTDRAGSWAGMAVVAIWAVAYVIVHSAHLGWLPGIGLMLRLLGLGAGISIASWISSAGLLRFCGRNTLPIYLSHTIFIGAIAHVFASTQVREQLQPFAWALPGALTIVAVLAALGLWRLLLLARAGWMYTIPRPVQRWLGGPQAVRSP